MRQDGGDRLRQADAAVQPQGPHLQTRRALAVKREQPGAADEHAQLHAVHHGQTGREVVPQ